MFETTACTSSAARTGVTGSSTSLCSAAFTGVSSRGSRTAPRLREESGARPIGENVGVGRRGEQRSLRASPAPAAVPRAACPAASRPTRPYGDAQFNDASFDQIASASPRRKRRSTVDVTHRRVGVPVRPRGPARGGQAARGTAGGGGGSAERPLLTAPTHADVLTYWTRAGFFREAAELFEIHGKIPRVKAAEQSDVLLPVTPVRAAEDVHAVVSNINSARLPSWRPSWRSIRSDDGLRYGAFRGVSEYCRTRGHGRLVAVQAYHWRRKLAKRVVVIAVADAGVGFRHSSSRRRASASGRVGGTRPHSRPRSSRA